MSIFNLQRQHCLQHLLRSHKTTPMSDQDTLAGVRPGGGARLLEFAPGLGQERRMQLRAYGLVPGRQMRVIQAWPVIVVQVEHNEIAIENELAEQIWVCGDDEVGGIIPAND